MGWSIDYVQHWRKYMSLFSAIRYRGFVLRYSRGRLRRGKLLDVSLHHPVHARFKLREVGSDPSLFQELFVTDVYRDVASNVQKCDTIVDLGANIGLASLYFADRYPSARIVAVEPFPENYEMLRSNLGGLIRKGRAGTIRAAISNSSSEVKFALPEDGSFCEAQQSSDGEVSAPPINMDELIRQQNLEKIDLLKVDIEGGEVELFKGPCRWLERVRAIAIEFHGDSRLRTGFDALMARYGLQLRSSNAHTVLAMRA